MFRNKKNKSLIFGLILILLIGIGGYEFLFGKLFPFSPFIVGFTKHELTHTVIYVQNKNRYDDFVTIDNLIPKVESFHELRFKDKPEIFIFNDSGSYVRRSLSTRPRFVTYYNRIFISPWALKESIEGKISLKIFMQHELSHALIYQHSGFVNANKYPKWLLEGIAVYSSNQMGTFNYPSKQKTYELMNRGYFLPPEYFRTSKEKQIKLDSNGVSFLYAEFACIVDYLVQTYGKEKLIQYMKELSKNAENEKVFKEVYGIEFSQAIQNFKIYVSKNGKTHLSLHYSG